jgi:glycosyltransferase involved in cell wall biosynthesis
MRILLLSWYFPPINDIGAVRVGKLAEYLHTHGHDVWVVTARRNDSDRSLSLGIPPARVIETNWIDLDRLSSPWNWISRPPANKGIANKKEISDQPERSHLSLRSSLARQYMWLVRIPDRQGGWLPYLKRAASQLLSKDKFDLIYASGPPFTTFFAAKNLSRRFGVPWIAEYRDDWSDYHLSLKPKWRGRLDGFFEYRITPSAAGIVAVSDPWARFYEQEFHKPTVAIYNGFDSAQGLELSQVRPGLPLTIVHMGAVYSGLRDPTVLFEAMNLAGIKPGEVEVGFYGADPGSVIPRAAKYGVSQLVTVPPRVPYGKALEIQRTSDVLLLLQSPSDLGHVPAKMFEYFAARRPILGLGLDQGIPARLVRERKAGCYATDVTAVAEQLKIWVEQKRRDGFIPALPESAAAGLSREEQLAKLEPFLESLAHVAAAASRSASAHSG